MNIDLRTDICITEEYQTVAYYMDKRIAIDTNGELYFEVIPKSCICLTDMLTREQLTPIDKLSKEEQVEIYELIHQSMK